MSLGWATYRLMAPVLGALAPMARGFTSPHERVLWDERLGEVTDAGECDAWVHAASLGEALAVPSLVHELIALAPRARLRLTATTRTGRGRLASLGLPVSLAPLDTPQAIERFFARARPQRVVLVETELWPHWLLRARAGRTPVVVVSARLSVRSLERYRHLGATFRSLIRDLAGVVAQSDLDAARWIDIGATESRVAVAGNLKHDALPAAAISRGAARVAAGLERDVPLLVLGSLRSGEGAILARAWLALPEPLRRAWQVVAVPRHARATAEIAGEASVAGVSAAEERNATGTTWRWDGRPGVLPGYYAGAEVAFVGGSLVRRGGHNPLEPAACGAAVLMGPHHAAQHDSVRALEERGAIAIVRGTRETASALEHLLGDEPARARQAEAGRAVADSLRGVAKRTVARLAAWDVWPPR